LVVTRYADCRVVTRDPRLRHRHPDLRPIPGVPDWSARPALRHLFNGLILLNPPDHTRLRRLVSSAFTPQRVLPLRATIERMVADLLDAMTGEVDFVRAFAFQLPVNVLGEVLGVPAEDRAMLPPLVREWTQILEAITPDALIRADAAAATLRDYLAGLIAERRRRPTGDLLSALAAADQQGDELTEEELGDTVANLIYGGLESTTGLLSNGLVALMQHPEQADLLRERPDLVPSAVDELLRFDSPIQIVPRSITAPVGLGGNTIPAGERVVAYLGAGNRDPARFTNPHRLDLSRADNAPLSFGGGIHYCVGAPLARLQAEVAFPALVRAFPKLALRGVPERRDSLTIRGHARLLVDVGT
jgi:cytochrome P450